MPKIVTDARSIAVSVLAILAFCLSVRHVTAYEPPHWQPFLTSDGKDTGIQYSEVDLGISIYTRGLTWIDDQTLFAFGEYIGQGADDRIAPLTRTIFLWEINKGISQFAKGDQLCVNRSNGNFSIKVGQYRTDSNKEFSIYEQIVNGTTREERLSDSQLVGFIFMVGSLKEGTKRIKGPTSGQQGVGTAGGTYFQKIPCWYVQTPPAYWPKFLMISLLPEHGSILRPGRQSPNQTGEDFNLIFENPVGQKQILPINRNIVSALNITYEPYKGAYFLYDNRWPYASPRIPGAPPYDVTETWRTSNCKDAWWIYPTGKVDHVCIPFVEGITFGYVFPFRDGYLIFGRSEKSSSGEAEGELVLITKENRVIRLANGLLSASSMGSPLINPSVSPDGCLFALSARKAAEKLGPVPDVNSGHRTHALIFKLCS